MTNTQTAFLLTGYEKDSDIWETVASGDDIDELRENAHALIKTGARCKATNEPFDWFEIARSTAPNQPIEIIN